MNIKFKLLFLLVIVMSCNADSSDIMEQMISSDDSVMDDSSIMDSDFLLKGDFQSDTHTTEGACVINKEGTTLTIENFKTDAGPKLLMYLSTDEKATDFIDLGELKGLDGDYVYAIPANTDFEKYKVAIVWCVDFSVSFGHADLN